MLFGKLDYKGRFSNLFFTGDPSHHRNKHWLWVKGWKKIYQANGPPKQSGVAILTLDKVHFKLTLIKQDKEGHSILIKGEIH
jgi:hypothetical protein